MRVTHLFAAVLFLGLLAGGAVSAQMMETEESPPTTESTVVEPPLIVQRGNAFSIGQSGGVIDLFGSDTTQLEAFSMSGNAQSSDFGIRLSYALSPQTDLIGSLMVEDGADDAQELRLLVSRGFRLGAVPLSLSAGAVWQSEGFEAGLNAPAGLPTGRALGDQSGAALFPLVQLSTIVPLSDQSALVGSLQGRSAQIGPEADQAEPGVDALFGIQFNF